MNWLLRVSDTRRVDSAPALHAPVPGCAAPASTLGCWRLNERRDLLVYTWFTSDMHPSFTPEGSTSAPWAAEIPVLRPVALRNRARTGGSTSAGTSWFTPWAAEIPVLRPVRIFEVTSLGVHLSTQGRSSAGGSRSLAAAEPEAGWAWMKRERALPRCARLVGVPPSPIRTAR